jgi:hypothetical protein
VGKKDDGQLSFHHKLTYSLPDKEKDKKYAIELLSSDFIQTPLNNTMYWFNPILDIGAFAGGNVLSFANWSDNPNVVSFGMDLGLTLSSYGETKSDSWFRLFRLGVGYDAQRKAGHFSFAPITFNIGKPLPLITNLYISPSLAIDTAGGLIIALGLGVQL